MSKSFGRSGGGYVQYPIITLNGKWIRETGFRTGQVIDIHYRPGAHHHHR